MNQNVIDNDNVKDDALSNVNEKSSNNVTSEVKVLNEPSKEENMKTPQIEKKPNDDMNLTHLDKDFVYELMSIPTLSDSEYRLITFIVLWARRNNIKYEFDTYGNLYLTKGEISEGEFYPCVTAHLDSVQQKHKMYAQAGQPLEVKTRIVNKKHEIYVDGMGIGGDDKAGVLIGLSMFKHVDKLKACFFLEEETGCRGSKNLNKEWFNNVGYVLGYDSPDLDRAAYACSGTRLFSADFFKTYMQEICKKHGLTHFHSEPFTDVKEIRERTNIICMNFGSGYYNAHMSNEYCVIEDMDTACRMGHELIEFIGLTRHELEYKSISSAWVKMADGSYKKPEEDKDEAFFRTLSGYGSYTYPSVTAKTSSSTTNVTKVTSSTTVSNASTSQTKEVNKDVVEIETLEYISTRYEEQISLIKENIQNICKENDIDFEKFAKVFDFEIKF